jgi:uncharacterized protein DUF4381
MNQDIHDIRGPIPIPPGWLLPLIALAAAALLALLAFLVARWWRRRKARPKPARSPEEIVFERLEAARRLIDPPRPREFAAAVSDAVRLYIEDRFTARAARRTTEEFLADLRSGRDPALGSQRDLLAEFLEHCDLAKFAQSPLGRGEMESLHASAVRFVDGVCPRPDGTAGASRMGGSPGASGAASAPSSESIVASESPATAHPTAAET